jgi:hypothetical protein
MHLKQLFVPVVKKPAAPETVRQTPVQGQEDEEYVFGDVMSVNGKTRLKRELEMLKDSNPALYDKIVNMK